MSQQQPKRHHYIPQFIIKNFSDSEGKVWVFDKNSRSKKVQRMSPRAVFWERHIYSGINAEYENIAILERAYAKLEGQWADLFGEIQYQLRRDSIPNLSENARKSIDSFIYNQFKRVPEFFTRLDSWEYGDDFFKAVIDGHKNADEIKAFIASASEAEKKRLYKNSVIQALSLASDEVMDVIARKNLFFVRLIDTKKSFILGSKPIGRFNDSGRQHLLDSNVELSMPIASDLAIGLFGNQGTVQCHTLSDRDTILGFNQSTVSRSNIVCGRSKGLVEKLTKKYTKAY